LQLFLKLVTDFGDSAMTLPMALLTFGLLLAARCRRAALGWVLAIVGCGLTIGLLKLALLSCGHRLLTIELTNPSGHTAMSAALYPSLAVLVGAMMPIYRRLILIGSAVAFSGAIAFSRVILGYHSEPEAVAGMIVGLAATAVFATVLASAPAPEIRLDWFLSLAALLIAVMYGSHWPIEKIVHSLVALIKTAAPACH
jgi:membrane-associated phospholipid phosphatase